MYNTLSWLHLPNIWAIKARYLNATRMKMLRNDHKILARKSAQVYVRDLNADGGIILKWILNKQVVVKDASFKWIRLISVVGFL
jgi:hypothetical protein